MNTTQNARGATLKQIMLNIMPNFLDPVPTIDTVRNWFDAANIPRFKMNSTARRGGGTVWYSVPAVEKFLRSKITLPPVKVKRPKVKVVETETLEHKSGYTLKELIDFHTRDVIKLETAKGVVDVKITDDFLVGDLGLSVRLHNCLNNLRIDTVGNIKAFNWNRYIRNFGNHTLEELRGICARHKIDVVLPATVSRRGKIR